MPGDQNTEGDFRYNRKGRPIISTPGERLPGCISTIFAFLIPVLVIAKRDSDVQTNCYIEILSQVIFLIKAGIITDKICFAQSLFIILFIARASIIVFTIAHEIKHYIKLYGKHKFVALVVLKQGLVLLLMGILVAFFNDPKFSSVRIFFIFLCGISLGILFITEGLFLLMIYTSVYYTTWRKI